nr:uncharacterized protein LOC116809158 [Taeniopygia guttata]
MSLPRNAFPGQLCSIPVLCSGRCQGQQCLPRSSAQPSVVSAAAALAEAQAGNLLLARNARALQARDSDQSHLQRWQHGSNALAFLVISLFDTRMEKKSRLPAQLNGALGQSRRTRPEVLRARPRGDGRFAAEVTHVLPGDLQLSCDIYRSWRCSPWASE